MKQQMKMLICLVDRREEDQPGQPIVWALSTEHDVPEYESQRVRNVRFHLPHCILIHSKFRCQKQVIG